MRGRQNPQRNVHVDVGLIEPIQMTHGGTVVLRMARAWRPNQRRREVYHMAIPDSMVAHVADRLWEYVRMREAATERTKKRLRGEQAP